MKTTKMFFSVIIPVYNKIDHVERAICSVCNQGFSDWELLLVDDGSTDGCQELIRSYQSAKVRVFYRKKPGPGGYAARNLGIENSRGEWIAFLDADDEWLPQYLENTFNLINQFPSASMTGCPWYISKGQNRSLSPLGKKRRTYCLMTPEEYLRIQASGVDVVHTNVTTVRRSLLTQVGGFPMSGANCQRAGDGKTWLRCVLTGAHIAWRPEPGAVYWQDAQNMVTRKRSYPLSENCLINFLENAVKDKKYSLDQRKLLKKYRDTRVISHLFQRVSTGEVSSDCLRKALQCRSIDLRVVILFVAFLMPTIGKLIFSTKRLLTGVQTQ